MVWLGTLAGTAIRKVLTSPLLPFGIPAFWDLGGSVSLWPLLGGVPNNRRKPDWHLGMLHANLQLLAKWGSVELVRK